MTRRTARLSIVVLTLFLVATFFAPQASIVEAQGGCTSQQILQADRLLRDAQDALGNGNAAEALKALQDAEAILQQCAGGAAPTLIPTRVVIRTATPSTAAGTTKSFVGSKSGIKF